MAASPRDRGEAGDSGVPGRRRFAVTDPHPALEGALGRHPVPTGEGQSKIKTDQSGILLMAFL